MNTKELLNHKKKCLIHNLPFQAADISGLSLKRTDNTLSIVIKYVDTSHRKTDLLHYINFLPNGKYSCTKNFLEYVGNSFQIYMACEQCRSVPIYKVNSIGETTFNNIMTKQHYYTFNLVAEPNGEYTGQLVSEEIKYNEKDTFYHMGVDLQTKAALCHVGCCAIATPFKDIVASTIKINAPQLNIEKIESLDQYIQKLKTYVLFS